MYWRNNSNQIYVYYDKNAYKIQDLNSSCQLRCLVRFIVPTGKILTTVKFTYNGFGYTGISLIPIIFVGPPITGISEFHCTYYAEDIKATVTCGRAAATAA